MKYIFLELQQIGRDFLKKMNVSAELKAAKTDIIHKKVDEHRMRRNYLKLIPSSLLLVLIELCGMLYHLFGSNNAALKAVYVSVFTVIFFTAILILVNINREL